MYPSSQSFLVKWCCQRRRIFLPEIIKKKDGVSDRYYIKRANIEGRQSKRPLTASKCISLVRIGGIDEYFSFSKNGPFFINNSNILTTLTCQLTVQQQSLLIFQKKSTYLGIRRISSQVYPNIIWWQLRGQKRKTKSKNHCN